MIEARIPADVDRFRLDERLAAAGLAPSEQAVATYVARHRADVPFMSAMEIAAAAGVGPATVVRFAQRLGYEGLPELKRELRGHLQARALARLGPSGTVPAAEPPIDPPLDELIDEQAAIVREIAGPVHASEFGQAVDLLAKSDRVVVFIGGVFAGLAQYLARRLRIAGHRILLLDTVDVSEALVEVGEGDVVVVLAFEEVSDRMSTVFDIAGQAGVPILVITERFALALRGRYTVAINVPRAAIFDDPSGVAIVATIDALLLGLTRHDRARRASASSTPHV